MITIVLAEDHRIVRQGLRALLKAEPGFSIGGETGDGLEAVELVERLEPDVLVVDLMLPSLDGIEVMRQVVKRSPKTHVVILSMHANEAYVTEALMKGAGAYVLKEASKNDLVRAIREVIAGKHFLSAPLAEHAIKAYIEKGTTELADPYETLTKREREVLHLAAEAHTNNEIAARLSISHRTVETHRANLMRKLNLRSQTDLIRFALSRGIIPMDD
ncbi:MAG: response regulator [Anaerolineales bacterium]